jgi:hypothetical protein
VLCDINRICELEDAVPEWIKLGATERDHPNMPIDISIYNSRFKVLGTYYNELD